MNGTDHQEPEMTSAEAADRQSNLLAHIEDAEAERDELTREIKLASLGAASVAGANRVKYLMRKRSAVVDRIESLRAKLDRI